jgi:hypothetical protein
MDGQGGGGRVGGWQTEYHIHVPLAEGAAGRKRMCSGGCLGPWSGRRSIRPLVWAIPRLLRVFRLGGSVCLPGNVEHGWWVGGRLVSGWDGLEGSVSFWAREPLEGAFRRSYKRYTQSHTTTILQTELLPSSFFFSRRCIAAAATAPRTSVKRKSVVMTFPGKSGGECLTPPSSCRQTENLLSIEIRAGISQHQYKQTPWPLGVGNG